MSEFKPSTEHQVSELKSFPKWITFMWVFAICWIVVYCYSVLTSSASLIFPR